MGRDGDVAAAGCGCPGLVWSCCWGCGGEGGRGGRLVQRFASIALLVQAAFAALHHVDEVGERLLLVYWDVPEVTTHSLRRDRKETKNKEKSFYKAAAFIAAGSGVKLKI